MLLRLPTKESFLLGDSMSTVSSDKGILTQDILQKSCNMLHLVISYSQLSRLSALNMLLLLLIPQGALTHGVKVT
jgi:hypothetical protein